MSEFSSYIVMIIIFENDFYPQPPGYIAERVCAHEESLKKFPDIDFIRLNILK
jgi:hypothetical protein